MNDFGEAAGLRNYPLARRGLVMTSLISGFTLAIDRVEAQTITIAQFVRAALPVFHRDWLRILHR